MTHSYPEGPAPRGPSWARSSWTAKTAPLSEDERLFVITRWGGREEPSTLSVTFKMMINGLWLLAPLLGGSDLFGSEASPSA